MGREGIEPPQSKTADLQSAELTTCSTYPLSVPGDAAASWCTRHAMIRAGADDGTRTRNRRFTKPLLYQLSYVGARRTIPQVTLWRPGMIGPAGPERQPRSGSGEVDDRPDRRCLGRSVATCPGPSVGASVGLSASAAAAVDGDTAEPRWVAAS